MACRNLVTTPLFELTSTGYVVHQVLVCFGYSFKDGQAGADDPDPCQAGPGPHQ